MKLERLSFAKRMAGYNEAIELPAHPSVEGRLLRMVGLTLEAEGLQAALGSRCLVINNGGYHPVQVEADSLQVNQTTGEATFTGNVVIGQGEMRLSAAEVTVVYAAGGNERISSLRATGGVTLVSGRDAAEAQEAAYDVEAGTVALTGDVVLTQGQNVLSGQQATVDLNTGAANITGRVRTVLQPGGN